MVAAMRAEKRQILAGTAQLGNLGLKPSPMNSPDHDCATQVMYLLPSTKSAGQFIDIFPSVIAGKTGRHTYTEWDQVLIGAGAAHPAMNPYLMEANAKCRKTYSKDMCAKSLDILNRTVMVATHPEHAPAQIDDIIHNISVAARVVLGGMSREEANLRNVIPVDIQKFDVVSRDRAEARGGHPSQH
jgi:hypothetical protein